MLTTQQLSEFTTQGYLVLNAAASPAICQAMVELAKSELAQEVMPIEFEAETHYPGAPASLDVEGGRTARRLLQAYQRHHLFAEWAIGEVVAEPIRQLLGTDALLVQAHHNCMMTKQPRFSSETGWHRDIRYWHYPRPELISAWLALGDEREQNGCLLVMPGSHQLQLATDQLDERLFLRIDHPASDRLLKTVVPVELKRGDLLLFHSNLFHAAGRNQTQQVKYSLVFTYRAASNPPLPDTRSSRLMDIALSR
ncbi:phytanoyl-CoA hydroxylase [Chitinivorax tropicus]|uniref:Phytanoyl-CoA hydroxylase n=1 Tax=Chitinivorax tropicus TaxID=714531 RepID=A0A840MPB0_9PROT|nr:phytanoyl-CoA dioxygenase family protein [Chitinivorax tropicus]MBB5018582.1 phytanoyl-CoA hydroxylase [Chitinivorax tropicus]